MLLKVAQQFPGLTEGQVAILMSTISWPLGGRMGMPAFGKNENAF
jgi:hypothetical protein